MMKIRVDRQKIEVKGDKSILQAALEAGVYIPHLCFHPQLSGFAEMRSLKRVFQGGAVQEGEEGAAFEGCNLCLVEVEGREGLIHSCRTPAEDGISVHTDSEKLRKAREQNLLKMLVTHPHACLVCAQAQGCDRKICSFQIPEPERCCFKFGMCELQKVAEFIGLEKGIPSYKPLGIPVADTDLLFRRDYNLCIGCLRCVRVCKEVKGADALGFTVRDGRVTVGSKAPTLEESGCQFCGYCVEVCPTGALADKQQGAGARETFLVPCRKQCPSGINIPEFIRLLRANDPQMALHTIYEDVPFPGVLGRVCFHPCEEACRRGSVDESVAICALKRYASESCVESYPQVPLKPRSGKKVAVLGAGPAGLTAAFYLNRLGHSVKVFEALPEAGGMLRVGIPAFRLPRDVLDREIGAIEKSGVEIETQTRVDSVDSLCASGYEAVFVAVGAQKPLRLGIQGEDQPGVIDGMTFLRNLNLGRQNGLGERVAVIGGGNVALDSARSALRSGAADVTIFYRRTNQEMPAYKEEVEAALEEGVKIEYQVMPKAVLEGGLVEFVRTEMKDSDENGRRRFMPVEGSEFRSSFDALIVAVGQEAEVPADVHIQHGPLQMEVDEGKGIFIGGDLLSGAATVVEAIASGKKAAQAIDKYLGGDAKVPPLLPPRERQGSLKEAAAMGRGRAVMVNRAPGERACGFSEVTQCMEKRAAIDEAGRCLACDLRFRITAPFLPPEKFQAFSHENVQAAPDLEGVFVLYDEKKEIYKICGVENIREALSKELFETSAARYFDYEEDPMFTGKERQLTQQYMKKTGRMPPGNAELDDLF